MEIFFVTFYWARNCAALRIVAHAVGLNGGISMASGEAGSFDVC